MSREDIIYNAKLAEQAELYEDMVKYMKDVVKVLYWFGFVCLLVCSWEMNCRTKIVTS